MNITIYSGACTACGSTYDAFCEVAQEIDPSIEVVMVSDIVSILRKHILQTPAIEIDGVTICAGKHFTIGEAREMLKQKMIDS